MPNLVVAQPDASGGVCLFANQPTYLVVDLFGGLASNAVSLHAPIRAIDTRDAGGRPPARSVVTAATGAPPGTTGVLVNVTTTQPDNSGFLTAFPCGAGRPPTSNLNVVPQQTVANFATVRPDAAGNVCVFTNSERTGDRRRDGHDRPGLHRPRRSVAGLRQPDRLITRPVRRRAHITAR